MSPYVSRFIAPPAKKKRQEISSHGREHEYLYGRRFNNLKVLQVQEFRPKNIMWLCECKCGRKIAASYFDLVAERVKACYVCSLHES